jgi:hypothetical protein
VIRIVAVWLATAPIDMRAGTETALARVVAVIDPHYPKATQGRAPHPLPRMVRVYLMQQWINLPDPGTEDALYDSATLPGSIWLRIWCRMRR